MFLIRNFLVFLVLLSNTAFAKIVIKDKLAAETGIPQWLIDFEKNNLEFHNKVEYKTEAYTECRETKEIVGAYLCLSDTQVNMNIYLGRASAFVEGAGGNKGVVSKLNDETLIEYRRYIGGHDLRGQDLLTFHQAVLDKCKEENSELICLNKLETEIFQELILPMTSSLKNFVVITFAKQSRMNWTEVVTHEILHAQYFNIELFRQITDAFWAEEVSPEHKILILSALDETYDTSDELLMKNEFQAYILMTGAERSLLRGFVGKYRGPLMEKLKNAGIKPLQIKE